MALERADRRCGISHLGAPSRRSCRLLVVLPAPFGPSRPTTSPLRNRQCTSLTTVRRAVGLAASLASSRCSSALDEVLLRSRLSPALGAAASAVIFNGPAPGMPPRPRPRAASLPALGVESYGRSIPVRRVGAAVGSAPPSTVTFSSSLVGDQVAADPRRPGWRRESPHFALLMNWTSRSCRRTSIRSPRLLVPAERVALSSSALTTSCDVPGRRLQPTAV